MVGITLLIVGNWEEDTQNKLLLLSLNPSANMETEYIKFENKYRGYDSSSSLSCSYQR